MEIQKRVADLTAETAAKKQEIKARDISANPAVTNRQSKEQHAIRTQSTAGENVAEKYRLVEEARAMQRKQKAKGAPNQLREMG